MKKELRPVHDHISCDVCGRTILKGERTEAFLAPGGQRRVVCALCFVRAEHHGWIRESVAAGDLPTRVPRDEPRRPLFGRLRGRRGGDPAPKQADDAAAAEDHDAPGAQNGAPPEEPVEPAPRPRSQPRDPRHVRAVPTTAEVKIERALDLFNGSDHQRTIAGLARTLGAPWVTAVPDSEQASAVTVVVAWELSWYRYRIDLGDEANAITLLGKGEEIEEIDEPLREWNATIEADGRIVAGHALSEEGAEG
ncbi:MAG TPA: hypothetical protein VEQ61_03560 [Thermoleophilaceae bacterium]|nr:hypothetical protein [Thermoleophilaceae bacterium]